MKTILFVFAGRRPNLEIQMPFLRRIRDEHPCVEVHLWDLCRTHDDSKYLRTLTGERITVRRDFADLPQGAGINQVWNHYAAPEYRDCVFAKLDDDDLFIETNAFGSFVQAAVDNPDSVVSALTINNGASTDLLPDVWSGFEQLDIPLLDVHLSPEYAELSHRWFFQNWQTIIGKPPILTPVETWLSINMMAYTYEMGCSIAALIGTRSPHTIADRTFPRRNARGRMSGHHIGDEGAFNLQPRLIHHGMVAAHLGFGPQIFADGLIDELRKNYQELAREYLGSNASRVE